MGTPSGQSGAGRRSTEAEDDATKVGADTASGGGVIRQAAAVYPYLEKDDIREALAYAAWRVKETEVPLGK